MTDRIDMTLDQHQLTKLVNDAIAECGDDIVAIEAFIVRELPHRVVVTQND